MEFEESIYNLIPKEQHVPEKAKRHKSQFPGTLHPTASTFGLGTTSKPQCSNLAGKFNLEGGSHSHKAGGATMGNKPGSMKPDTTIFRKKNTGNPVLVAKDEVGKMNRAGDKKPGVPKMDDKPIQGLVSDKNFIVANAVENILAAPKLGGNKEKDMLKKKNYGKTPKYLTNIKNEIEDEYNLVREMQIEEQAEEDRRKYLMPDEERKELIGALKKKWEVLHIEYQKESHYRKLDTMGKASRKINLEKEMEQIEKDIRKLTKNYIFIDTTQPSSAYW